MLSPKLNYAPEEINSIHIMGICGTGMAALAGMLKKSGFVVTGSDSKVYPPMSEYLASLGIVPANGYKKENLNCTPDLVIVGNVITKKNPEAIELSKREIPYLSFPQALAHFFISKRNSIVISGTHGKTTTSSLLASSLYHLEMDPSFMIGGIVSEFQSNNRIGEGGHFVSEGDEYDTAFFDKESKFLHYLPKVAVITSVEFDHADIFDDIEQIKNSFKKFISLIPEDGLIIANLDDKNVAEVVAHASCSVQGYGTSEQNTWVLKSVSTENGHSNFSFSYKGNDHNFTVPLIGKHNCLNTMAVIGILNHIGINFKNIQRAINCFQGVKRRQEVRGVERDITVIDDFAHHPTAVKETLDGLKQSYGSKRLIAVFEPRTNSSRRTIFQEEYAKSFDSADLVILREPLPLENIPKEELFSSSKLASDLNLEKKTPAKSFENTDEILNHLQTILIPGDIVAILSNGGFDNIHQRLIEQIKKKGGEK